MYLTCSKKKNRNKEKKLQSWEKEKLHMPYEVKSVLARSSEHE